MGAIGVRNCSCPSSSDHLTPTQGLRLRGALSLDAPRRGPTQPWSPWRKALQGRFPEPASETDQSVRQRRGGAKTIRRKRTAPSRRGSKGARSLNSFETKGQNKSMHLNLQFKVIHSAETSSTFQVSFL